MFAWWGRTVYRYRYIVIGVMVALCLGGGVYGISLGQHVTQSGFYDEGSQSVHASVIADEVYGRDTSGHIVGDLHRARRQDRRRPGVPEEDPRQPGPGREGPPRPDPALDRLLQEPRQCSRTWPTPTRQHAFMSIQLKGNDDDTILNELQEPVEDRPVRKHRRRRRRQAGRPAAAGQRADRHHRRRPEARRGGGHPAGRAWCCSSCSAASIAAALPGIIGGLTIAGALGIMRLVAEFTPVHFFAQPVVTLIGLGIADRLRPVHREPVPRGDRRGLRHRGRRPPHRDDLGPHGDVLRGDHRGVVGAAAAVPAGLPEVHHLRDHRLGHAGGDPVDHRAGRRAGHPRAQRRRARRAHAAAGAVPAATGSSHADLSTGSPRRPRRPRPAKRSRRASGASWSTA